MKPKKTKAELLKQMHGDDEDQRDEILRKVLTHLSKHGIPYTPLAAEEDIQTSYEDDALEEFRETARSWMQALVGEAA